MGWIYRPYDFSVFFSIYCWYFDDIFSITDILTILQINRCHANCHINVSLSFKILKLKQALNASDPTYCSPIRASIVHKMGASLLKYIFILLPISNVGFTYMKIRKIINPKYATRTWTLVFCMELKSLAS